MNKYDKYKLQSPQGSLDSKYAKYRLVLQKQEGDSWWQLPQKAVGKFATEIAGLPLNREFQRKQEGEE